MVPHGQMLGLFDSLSDDEELYAKDLSLYSAEYLYIDHPLYGRLKINLHRMNLGHGDS